MTTRTTSPSDSVPRVWTGPEGPRNLIAWAIRDTRSPEEAAHRIAAIVRLPEEAIRLDEVRALAALRLRAFHPKASPAEVTEAQAGAVAQFLNTTTTEEEPVCS